VASGISRALPQFFFFCKTHVFSPRRHLRCVSPSPSLDWHQCIGTPHVRSTFPQDRSSPSFLDKIVVLLKSGSLSFSLAFFFLLRDLHPELGWVFSHCPFETFWFSGALIFSFFGEHRNPFGVYFEAVVTPILGSLPFFPLCWRCFQMDLISCSVFMFERFRAVLTVVDLSLCLSFSFLRPYCLDVADQRLNQRLYRSFLHLLTSPGPPIPRPFFFGRLISSPADNSRFESHMPDECAPFFPPSSPSPAIPLPRLSFRTSTPMTTPLTPPSHEGC